MRTISRISLRSRDGVTSTTSRNYETLEENCHSHVASIPSTTRNFNSNQKPNTQFNQIPCVQTPDNPSPYQKVKAVEKYH